MPHHGAHGGHGHTHGTIDPTIATTDRGIWAIKWSFVILAITAALQLVVVFMSGSIALLADTIHNFGDATTAIPLWIAFALARRKPTPTFSYGYGRVEDIAGVVIVLIILISAIVAGYEAINRLVHPQAITQLPWVAIAGIVGFVGNEVVAVFRIRVGREINSAALIADGYHARTDGLTSLAVVVGAAVSGWAFRSPTPSSASSSRSPYWGSSGSRGGRCSRACSTASNRVSSLKSTMWPSTCRASTR